MRWRTSSLVLSVFIKWPSSPTRHSSPATSTKSSLKGQKRPCKESKMGFLMGHFYIWVESSSEYQQIFLNVPNSMKIPPNWSITGLFFHSSCWVSRDDLNHPESLEHFKGGRMLGTQTHKRFVLHALSSSEAKSLP